MANEPAISMMEQNFSRLGIEDGSFILDDTRRSMDYVPRMRASLSPAGDLVGKVAQYSHTYIRYTFENTVDLVGRISMSISDETST